MRHQDVAEAIIFDIDGTLLDSVDLHAQAWQKAFQHYGRVIPVEEIRKQIGKGGDQLLPVFLSQEEIDRFGKELEKFRGALFKREYLPCVKAFPSVRELFKKIKDNGQGLALASSAKEDELESYERIANIGDLVKAETTSGDVEKTKPHPDIFEVALDKLGSKYRREDVIVVGDTIHDAEAAKRAGLATVGVVCGGSDEHELKAAGCIAIYRDPADILSNYESSPLARKHSKS